MKKFREGRRAWKEGELWWRRRYELQRCGLERAREKGDPDRPRTVSEMRRISRHIDKCLHGTRHSVARQRDICWENEVYMRAVLQNMDWEDEWNMAREERHSLMEQARVGDIDGALKRLGNRFKGGPMRPKEKYKKVKALWKNGPLDINHGGV